MSDNFEHSPQKLLTVKEATEILETVLDTFSEVGNGVTDEKLHETVDLLFHFRDNWFHVVREYVEDIYDAR